jgi:potassium efflux system protein
VAALLILIVLVFPMSSFSQVQNQTAANQPDSGADARDVGELSLDELKAKRASVESSGDLAELVKKNVLRFLDKTIRFREKEAQLNKSNEEIARMVKTAPERIKEIENELDRQIPEAQSIESKALRMEPAEVEQQFRQVEANLASANSNLNNREDQSKELGGRPEQLQKDISRAKKRLMDVEIELMAVRPADESPLVTEVRRAALLAEQEMSQAEIKTYEQQLVNHDALMALITAERDIAARKAAQQKTLFKIWQVRVQSIREFEAKKERVEAEQAKDLAIGLPAFMQKQFDKNIKLGKILEDVTAEEAKITETLEQKKNRLKLLEEEFALVHEQVKYPIHTEAIGLALLEQRQALPSILNYRRESAQRQVLMGEIRSTQLNLDRQRRELADLDQAINRMIESSEVGPEVDIEYLNTELRRLLADRRDVLKKLQAGYQRLFKKIQSLEFIEQEIATKAEAEARFLDGHLLWMRSAKTIGLKDFENLPGALGWMINPHHWWQVVQDFGRSFRRSPVAWLLGLLIAGFLIGCRRWARRNLSHVAQKVVSVHTDSFVLTLRALGLTGLLAFGWPIIMGYVGWQLLFFPTAQDFTRAVGNGLIIAAQAFATVYFVYQVCRKDGIGEAHFKWRDGVRRTLRQNLFWLMQIAVPLSFMVAAVQTQNMVDHIDSMGRMALICVMLALSVFVARVLRFSGEIMTRLIRSRRESWLVRFRFLWYPLAMGVPLVLCLLAGMGYYYSALALDQRLGQTIWLIIALIIINGLVIRWLFVTRRRLALEKARRRREAERALTESQQVEEADAGEDLIVSEEPEIGLAQINEQTRALLRTLILFASLIGLWVIWRQVLPALNLIGDVGLWTYSTESDGVTKIIPITLTNLVTAVILAAVTFVAARNLPGVLEITILKHLPMDAGARHAFTTLCRYAIVALGIILTFNSLGIRWTSLQWLIAALGVGLGFGLQEIVANFVSGLIVLFERPYRVGDFVTVGAVSGTVTRIRIRATTVRDLDRRELIVPNKNFITGELINWSLSDKILRITIPVGIAYGSDTALAEELLLKVARENPEVLGEPEPSALFLEFGDNSLNFEVRVYIDDPMKRFRISHQLHRSIDDEFRRAGVVIAFPQRDVHLDQIGRLEVNVVSNQAAQTAKTKAGTT